jgi:citrate synthase
MEGCQPILNTGLRGFKVATTRVGDVDGTAGRLIYRGYLVQDLAGKVSFEEVVYLLLYERLPQKTELENFKEQLVSERSVPPGLITALETIPKSALPMDVLQAAAALLAHYDPDTKEHSSEAAFRMGIKLIAKLPTIVAAWDRIRNNKKPIDPDPELSHAANFLYMLNGTIPDNELTGFFDTCLVLHAEHSFNASTFSARQVASTRAHMYSAVAGGIGSLSGELHGGANTRVMEMLLKIGSVDKVEAYVNNLLDTGGVIMGLGHAVYKTDDPRAHILAPMSKKMGERVGEPKWYEMSKVLEKKVRKPLNRERAETFM